MYFVRSNGNLVCECASKLAAAIIVKNLAGVMPGLTIDDPTAKRQSQAKTRRAMPVPTGVGKHCVWVVSRISGECFGMATGASASEAVASAILLMSNHVRDLAEARDQFAIVTKRPTPQTKWAAERNVRLMPFGKYAGVELCNVPYEALDRMIDKVMLNDPMLAAAMIDEMEKRRRRAARENYQHVQWRNHVERQQRELRGFAEIIGPSYGERFGAGLADTVDAMGEREEWWTTQDDPRMNRRS